MAKGKKDKRAAAAAAAEARKAAAAAAPPEEAEPSWANGLGVPWLVSRLASSCGITRVDQNEEDRVRGARMLLPEVLAPSSRRCYCFAYVFAEKIPILVISGAESGEAARTLAANTFGVRQTDIKYASHRDCARKFKCASNKLTVLQPPPGVCVLVEESIVRDPEREVQLDPLVDIAVGAGFTLVMPARALQSASHAITARPLLPIPY